MGWQMIVAAAAMAVGYRATRVEQAPAAPVFVGACPDNIHLEPLPIDPSWILSGTPHARSGAHSRAEDGCAVTGIWDCTAGSFRWFFGWDETVVILEGEVHVTAEDGAERTLRKGDVAYFKGGTWATWHIETYVRKIAFLRKPFPAPIVSLFRLKKALRPKPALGLAA
jgi:uncharacterized cupin superfamily protein